MAVKPKPYQFIIYFAALATLIGGGCGFVVEDDGYYYDDNYDPGYYTIQEAIDYAQPGDTVFIESGVYSPSTNGEYFPIYMKDGVTLEGEDPYNTILDAEGSATVLNVIDYNFGTISGFTVTNGQSSEGGGIYVQDSSGTIENMILIGNEAYNVGSAIFVVDSNVTLRNLVIANNFGATSGAEPAQVEISSSNVNFFNNVVSRGDTDGVRLEDGAGGIYENNIFYQNGFDGFGVGLADIDESTIANIQYNISFGNAEDDYYLNGLDLSSSEANDLFADDQITNNLSTDPLFVDPATNDYYLQNVSPALNAGDPSPSFNNPDGSRNDIGAYGGPQADGF